MSIFYFIVGSATAEGVWGAYDTPLDEKDQRRADHLAQRIPEIGRVKFAFHAGDAGTGQMAKILAPQAKHLALPELHLPTDQVQQKWLWNNARDLGHAPLAAYLERDAGSDVYATGILKRYGLLVLAAIFRTEGTERAEVTLILGHHVLISTVALQFLLQHTPDQDKIRLVLTAHPEIGQGFRLNNYFGDIELVA